MILNLLHKQTQAWSSPASTFFSQTLPRQFQILWLILDSLESKQNLDATVLIEFCFINYFHLGVKTCYEIWEGSVAMNYLPQITSSCKRQGKRTGQLWGWSPTQCQSSARAIRHPLLLPLGLLCPSLGKTTLVLCFFGLIRLFVFPVNCALDGKL